MQAILAKSAAGQHKSKIIDPLLCQIVLEAYMTPEQFAELITMYDKTALEFVIIDKSK